MNNISIPLADLQSLIFVFFRLSAILAFLPLFDSRNLPVLFKGGMAFALSLIVTRLIGPSWGQVTSQGLLGFAMGAAMEILLGASLGMLVRVLLAGVQIAGQVMGFQMGFSLANVLDPGAGQQISLIAQAKTIMTMMILLAMNVHHWFILAVAESFRMIPPYGVRLNEPLISHYLRLGGNMFENALALAAPVMISLLLISVAFGLLARLVPQMNVFIVLFPIKIAVGIFVLGLSLPFMGAFIGASFRSCSENMMLLIKAMQ